MSIKNNFSADSHDLDILDLVTGPRTNRTHGRCEVRTDAPKTEAARSGELLETRSVVSPCEQ